MSNFFSNFFSKSAANNTSLPTQNTESVTAQVTELTDDNGEITVKVSVNFNSTEIKVKRGTPVSEIVNQALKLLGLTVQPTELTLLDTKTNQASAYQAVADETVDEDSEYSLQQSSGTAGM